VRARFAQLRSPCTRQSDAPLASSADPSARAKSGAIRGPRELAHERLGVGRVAAGDGAGVGGQGLLDHGEDAIVLGRIEDARRSVAVHLERLQRAEHRRLALETATVAIVEGDLREAGRDVRLVMTARSPGSASRSRTPASQRATSKSGSGVGSAAVEGPSRRSSRSHVPIRIIAR
jgi:hypothetical protein